jgi:hypothetical protein
MNEEKIIFDTQAELIDSESEGSAEASIGLNPAFKFLKFVLTDDKPNLNKQRIPIEEFDNIVRTGYLTPIKMGKGKIEQGHENASEIGVISHLKKTEDNKIVGLAAIWSKEHPDEYNYIKENYDKKTPLNISWEILYRDSTVDADGITDLKDTALKAAVLVGRPAYGGRTQILSVASEVNPDSEENMELKELEEQVISLKAELAAKETELSTKKEEVETKAAELETTKAELTKLAEDTKDYSELKEFKASALLEKEENEKFEGIKTKFSEAGLNKDETYFKDNKTKLVSMTPELLDFMVQELVAFKSTSASLHETVPNLTANTDRLTPKELGEALRKMKK